jgi:Tfp pilus assembly protein PilW
MIEIFVSSLLGLLVVGMLLSSTLLNRNLFNRDLVVSRINENVRGSIDILSINARLAGENLGNSFPAIEMSNGAAGATDTVIFRRNLLSEVLPVCVSLAAGSNSFAYFANGGTTAGCTYATQTSSYNAWRNYRIGKGGTTDAYIFNFATKQGEFFTYTSETNTGTAYYLSRSGNWLYAYPSASSSLYMLEEWKFDLSAQTLRLVVNQNNANPQTLAFDVIDFQSLFALKDGTTTTTFTAANDWTKIASIAIDLKGRGRFFGNDYDKTFSTRIFPRNILSN